MKFENNYLIFDNPQKGGIKSVIKNIFYYFKSFSYSLSQKPKMTKKKYYCSVCSIFRDEAQSMKEWLEFHKIIGIDHFYLYNNFSSDEYFDILAPYIDEGIVTLIDWPYNQAQIAAFQDCYDKFHNETNWIAYIDLDEFIVPNHMDNIKDFLVNFENYPSVLIYWKYMCSSGLLTRKKDGLVTEDFTVGWRKYANIGKIIFNTEYEYVSEDKHNSFMHIIWGKYNEKYFPPVNIFKKNVIWNIHRVRTNDFPIQINHYVTKSYQEYIDRNTLLD